MKSAYKFEFVVFEISEEIANLLWRIVARVIEYIGFDVTGNYKELSEGGK